MRLKWLLDLLFPKFCIGCGKFGNYVCDACQVGLWEEEQICPVCGRNSRYGLPHAYCHRPYGLDGLICLWEYEGIAKQIIKLAKYKGKFAVLEFLISNFPAKLSEFEINSQFTNFQRFLETQPIVIPVPLHKNRLRERGFNQSEVISRHFAKVWNLEIRNWLLRVKDTGHQTGRTRAERLAAVEEAFQISNLKFQIPEAVLLVDDVWTTGATMSECCKILKCHGVKRVWGLVLAR